MRYWYDTEFHEDGSTIDLISIGIVAEDGREYYACNVDANWDRIRSHTWLMDNVVPHLPLREPMRRAAFGDLTIIPLDRSSTQVKPKWVIANEVREFLLADDPPELWAWYAAYDHVALCQLWGAMIRLPRGIPMYTRDLKQEVDRLGNPALPEQESGNHNALADARHLRVRHEALEGSTS